MKKRRITVGRQVYIETEWSGRKIGKSQEGFSKPKIYKISCVNSLSPQQIKKNKDCWYDLQLKKYFPRTHGSSIKNNNVFGTPSCELFIRENPECTKIMLVLAIFLGCIPELNEKDPITEENMLLNNPFCTINMHYSHWLTKN